MNTTILGCCWLVTVPLSAQDRPAAPAPAPATTAPAATVKFPIDTVTRREAVATIKGQRVPYRATIGTQPVWDEKGVPIATLFYTYYERTDVTDKSTRPFVMAARPSGS